MLSIHVADYADDLAKSQFPGTHPPPMLFQWLWRFNLGVLQASDWTAPMFLAAGVMA